MKEMHVRRSTCPDSETATPSVRFSPHAIQRLRQRFGKFPAAVALIIEAGLAQSGTKCAIQSRWFAYGVICGSRVCIVLTQDRPGVFTVITGFCC